MRWTGWTAVGAGLLALAGCGYGYRAIGVQARYSTASRPDPSYFCYDCHGYRYFDPYYDYCDSRGFRYRWAAHPRSMIVYRERYVRIKEAHPDYGRYRYRKDYRSGETYREPPDYEAWRTGQRTGAPPEGGASKERKVARERKERKEREQDGEQPGKKKERKGDERKDPRGGAPRLALPGGVS